MSQIKKKIAALLAMTTTAGCTEAEALHAAAKAAELMQKHGLSEADIAMGQSSVSHPTKGRAARDPLWGAVGHCTNTVITYCHSSGVAGAELIFIGRDPGPEIAAYLVAVLTRALDTAVAEFKAGPFYKRRRSSITRRTAMVEFTTAMVRRLSIRLMELFAPVISKDETKLAVVARDRLFAESRDVARPKPGKARFDAAILSGWAAGGRVNLAQGVGGNVAPVRRIGGA